MTEEKLTLYRFGQENGRSGYNTRMKPWVTIGEERTLKGAISPCTRGFHASPTLWDALQYAGGPFAELVELSGDLQPHGAPVDKWVGRTRKLLARVDVSRDLRLFAADCAEHVLPLWEAQYPDDDQPRLAIQAARDFAEGRIDMAASSASSAAFSAAFFAAFAASAAASASYAAASSARSAASSAAFSAAFFAAFFARSAASSARSAAASAARSAVEREWQRQQFEARFAGVFGEVTRD